MVTPSNDQHTDGQGSSSNRLRLYQAMLAHASQGVWIIDQHARTVYVNAVMLAILGRTENETIGKRLHDLLPQDQHEAATQAFTARKNGHSQYVHYDVHRPDGTTIPTRVTASPIFDEDGTFLGASALFTEVAIAPQNRTKPEHYTAHLETMLENLPGILCVIDGEGTILSARGAGVSSLNITADQAIGKNIVDQLAELPNVASHLQEAMRSKSLQTQHTIHGRTYLTVFDPVILDEQNLKNGVIGVVIDMTQQADKESVPEVDDIRNQMILETISDIVYTQDRAGCFTSLNAAFGQVLGLNERDWIGQTVTDLLHPEDIHMHQMIARTLDGAHVPIYEVRLCGSDDDYVMLEINQQPIYQNGVITGVLGIARDITQRRQVEIRSLELALERERLVMLGRFVRDVSHDIRTPLSVISSNAYLARRKLSVGREDIEKHLHRIEAHVNDLGQHLTELLTLDQLSRHDIHPNEEIDLNALVSHVMAEYDLMARGKRHEMVFGPSNKPVIVQGDGDELIRVVRHLLVNAINYSPSGGSIRVTVRVEEHNVVITVQDNGIGISAEAQQSIFEPFFRVDTTRNHDTGGMGLGLNVAKVITEAHNGHIEVSSAVDVGSTFRVVLPLKD